MWYLRRVSSFLRVEYDGKRRGEGDREFVIIEPGDVVKGWGQRAYGLQRPKDDYSFDVQTPKKGDIVRLSVSHDTYNRLVRQRELIKRKRRWTKKKKPLWPR